jgi:hypothetical protein
LWASHWLLSGTGRFGPAPADFAETEQDDHRAGTSEQLVPARPPAGLAVPCRAVLCADACSALSTLTRHDQ